MPCQGPYTPAEEAQMRINELTRFLCYMCGEATVAGWKLPAPIASWWMIHQELDRARVAHKFAKEVDQYETPEGMAAAHLANSKRYHPVSQYHEGWIFEMARKAFEGVSPERIRRVALNKLTKRERQALGL